MDTLQDDLTRRLSVLNGLSPYHVLIGSRMSIEVDAEELIPFCKARSAFSGGKRLSLATLQDPD